MSKDTPAQFGDTNQLKRVTTRNTLDQPELKEMLVSALSSENSDVCAAYDHFNLMSWRPKQKLSNYHDLWEFKGVIISVFFERAILFALNQNLLRCMLQRHRPAWTRLWQMPCVFTVLVSNYFLTSPWTCFQTIQTTHICFIFGPLIALHWSCFWSVWNSLLC